MNSNSHDLARTLLLLAVIASASIVSYRAGQHSVQSTAPVGVPVNSDPIADLARRVSNLESNAAQRDAHWHAFWRDLQFLTSSNSVSYTTNLTTNFTARFTNDSTGNARLPFPKP